MKGLFGKDRVCGVVAAETAREMRSQVRLGLRKTRTLELRLDYLRNAKEREAFLSWLRRKRPRAVLIATCRRKEGGGLISRQPGRANRDPGASGPLRLRVVRC